MQRRGSVARHGLALGAAAVVLALGSHARATYSIAACDAATRACGVAVQTNNLAVGASVPYARAGVGAIVSQFETNPAYGPRGLALMADGMAPSAALARLLAEDGAFDGGGPEDRQVALVSIDGTAVAYTGAHASEAHWAGARSGGGYSVQGNGLAGPAVLEGMQRAFVGSPAPLAERLLAALSAGEAAGGQTTGRQSAALLVRTSDGFPMDVDLRVDSAADPIGELRGLYGMHSARQMLIDARNLARKGETARAKALMLSAIARAPTWGRAYQLAAPVAAELHEDALAMEYREKIRTLSAALVAGGDRTTAAAPSASVPPGARGCACDAVGFSRSSPRSSALLAVGAVFALAMTRRISRKRLVRAVSRAFDGGKRTVGRNGSTRTTRAGT